VLCCKDSWCDCCPPQERETALKRASESRPDTGPSSGVVCLPFRDPGTTAAAAAAAAAAPGGTGIGGGTDDAAAPGGTGNGGGTDDAGLVDDAAAKVSKWLNVCCETERPEEGVGAAGVGVGVCFEGRLQSTNASSRVHTCVR